MKINKLFLKAYGCFTDKTLDFSAHDPGMHIIFGPNEAGKSTAMRALNSFFFGFGHTCPDAFLHSYKDLAVGAVLENGPGRQVELTRYKRNRNDLVDSSEQPVDPGLMNTIMAGLTKDMYVNMFGLDHQSLRLGAQEILRGGGHLGETLFAAASGITSMRLALEELRKRADDLFTSRATSRPIWKNIHNISQLGKQLRQLSTRPEQWKQLVNNLEKITYEKKTVEKQVSDLESALNCHLRFQKALPLISGYDNLKVRLAELESVPDLTPDFAGKRIENLTGINRLKSELNTLYKVEANIKDELENIGVCETTLSFADEIERLFLKTSMIAQARESISDLELEINRLKSLVMEKSRLVPKFLPLESLGKFHLHPAQVKKLEELANELTSLKDRISQVEKDIMESEKDMDSTLERLSAFPEIPDRKKLETTSRKLAQAPELAEQERMTLENFEKLTNAVQKSIHSLGMWQGTLDEIQNLALPLQETIDRFDGEMGKTMLAYEAAQKEISDLQANISAKKKILEGINQDESLPGPDALSEARSIREQGWKLVKSAWLDQKVIEPETRNFIVLTDSTSLDDAFEKSLFRADHEADSLLKNADQVAARSALINDLSSLEQKQRDLEVALESASKKHDRVWKEWTALWSGLNIDPLTPREMTAWISRVNEIRRTGEALEHDLLHLKKIRERLDHLTDLSREALTEAGCSFSPDVDVTTLSVMVEEALERISSLSQDIAGLEHDEKKLRSSLDKLGYRKNELISELENKKAQWTRILAGSHLDPQQDPSDTLEEIRLIREIQADQNQIDKLVDQKSGFEKKCREFSSQVIKILKNQKYDLQEEDRPEDIMGRLHSHLINEQKKSQRKTDLQQRLDEARKKIDLHVTELQVLQGELELMRREAGAKDVADLPEIEEKSRQKAELQTKLEHFLDKLRDLSSGEDLAKFISRAKDFDPDQLQAIISKFENQKLESEIRRDEVLKEKHEAESQIKKMDGTSKALEVEQQIQEQRAFLENNVEQYIRLRLAADILATEIERYRIANQGPVLKIAGDIFRDITLCSFSTIMADYDVKGDPVIKAVRDSGARLGVEELSDGSRDQLFLALRLGGIFRYLDQNPPFPFLVDDILVHFDDERSSRTLSVLTELSRMTQVLFFTHHRHLMDLALRIPEKDMVKVHELENH